VRSRAATFVEVLVVLMLLSVIAVSASPILRTAIRAAKQANSMANLKQHHVAINLYAGDHISGPPSGLLLDLPANPVSLVALGYLDEKQVRPGHGGEGIRDIYHWFPPMGNELQDQSALADWKGYISLSKEDPVIMADPGWSYTDEVDLWSPRVGLGLKWSGSVIKKVDIGEPGSMEFWAKSVD